MNARLRRDRKSFPEASRGRRKNVIIVGWLGQGRLGMGREPVTDNLFGFGVCSGQVRWAVLLKLADFAALLLDCVFEILRPFCIVGFCDGLWCSREPLKTALQAQRRDQGGSWRRGRCALALDMGFCSNSDGGIENVAPVCGGTRRLGKRWLVNEMEEPCDGMPLNLGRVRYVLPRSALLRFEGDRGSRR